MKALTGITEEDKRAFKKLLEEVRDTGWMLEKYCVEIHPPDKPHLAQLLERVEDIQAQERRAIGEWLDGLSSSEWNDLPKLQKKFSEGKEALKQGTLPEGMVKR
jgi:hypothetical protein